MRLTKYGQDIWGRVSWIAVVLEIVVAVLYLPLRFLSLSVAITLFVLVGVVWLLIVGFFRDPNRDPSGNVETDLFSPADGTVRDITLLKNTLIDPQDETEKKALAADVSLSPDMRELFKGKDVVRIGIFLSVLSVHVNRVPAKLTVSLKEEREGAFYDARDPRAIAENESATIGGEGEVGNLKFPMAIKQISGAIARRIVCPVEQGQTFEHCELYGMIKFGSRTELYLPCDKFEILVSCGDSVFGGETAIARVKNIEK